MWGGRSALLLALGAVALSATIAATVFFARTSSAPSPKAAQAAATIDQALRAARAEYVGAVACKSCHESEFKAWTGSHHQLAMQVADESTIRGDFNGTKFTFRGVESKFSKRDGDCPERVIVARKALIQNDRRGTENRRHVLLGSRPLPESTIRAKKTTC